MPLSLLRNFMRLERSRSARVNQSTFNRATFVDGVLEFWVSSAAAIPMRYTYPVLSLHDWVNCPSNKRTPRLKTRIGP